MVGASAISNEKFWTLVFSTTGLGIAICVTIVVVAVIIFLLSRRFPIISLEYRGSKLELRRIDASSVSLGKEIGATTNSAETKPAEKDVADALAGANPKTEERFSYGDLIDAVEKRDRSKIEKIFEEFKVKPIFETGFPYELEVWKNVELLQAGFSDARSELERIEKENSKEFDASRALARYYLSIRASEQALPHIEIIFGRAATDPMRTTACLLKADYIEEVQGRRAATSFLVSELGLISDLESRSKLLADLGDRYKKDNREALAMAAYESALVCDVHNTGARFQLAYLYGENDVLRALAI